MPIFLESEKLLRKVKREWDFKEHYMPKILKLIELTQPINK
jgi:hypothetical protein